MDIDFFIVGSQRCGTTWIDTALRSTDEVLLPDNKQTYYFDRNYSKGIQWYFAQYNGSPADGYQLTGEVATGYCLEGAIERLADSFPNAKILLAVREPVSRAYSNYIKRRNEYQWKSFEEAIEEDEDLVARGLYGDMLERIYKHYPKHKVKIVFFEDLQKNPQHFIYDILEFLGLDCRINENLFNQNINSSIFEKVVNLAKNYKVHFLVRLSKKLGLTGLFRRVIHILHQKKKRPELQISEDVMERFRKSNKVLENYTNRKF